MPRSHTPENTNAPAEVSTTDSQTPSRAKRGKYVSKACDYCHQRKIKCDGETPCNSCAIKGRPCASSQNSQQRRKKRSLPTDDANPQDSEILRNHPALTMLLEKIGRLEQQVSKLSPPSNIETSRSGTRNPINPQSATEAADVDSITTHGRNEATDVPEDETLAQSTITEMRDSFIGETSISQTLQHVEESLQEWEKHTAGTEPSAASSKPSPSTEQFFRRDATINGKAIRQILLRHGISTRREEWDVLLDLFCEDVHCFYPFLHLPSLRQSYTVLCHTLSLTPPSLEAVPEESVDAIIQVLVCLALGRCTTSVRADTTAAPHSAGWSFYVAARELLGNMVDPLGEGSRELMRIQTLAIMVVYLIRLDAMERAQKVLSLAITQAHHLGLHREKVLASMPIFLSEASRRTWWSIYVLDRRLALDTGRPFLIQDINIDSKVPFNLTDSWLADQKHKTTPMMLMTSELEVGLDHDKETPIPYLVSMVGYSKIIGKVWDALYQAKSVNRAPNPTLYESFEALLAMWQQSLPADLSCDDSNADKMPLNYSHPWQAKNRFLICMRTIWLRILIRKPLSRQASPAEWLETFDNESVCIVLAEKIINLFSRIFDAYRVYTYPFLQYLMGAASIILGLIIKIPAFKLGYGNSLVCAVKMINIFCRKTWVSGKTVRLIARLTEMVSKILGNQAVTEVGFGDRTANKNTNQQYLRPEMHTTMSLSNDIHWRESNASRPQVENSGIHFRERSLLSSPPVQMRKSHLQDCVQLDAPCDVQNSAAQTYPVASPGCSIRSSTNPQWYNSNNPTSTHSTADEQQLVVSDFPFEESFSNGIAQLAMISDYEKDPNDPMDADWYEKLLTMSNIDVPSHPDMFSGGW